MSMFLPQNYVLLCMKVHTVYLSRSLSLTAAHTVCTDVNISTNDVSATLTFLSVT